MSNTTQRYEEIQTRAYQFWQERGTPFGTPETDWFRAEHGLEPNSRLAELARNVGGALGTVVALVTDKLPPR